jgi:hypothetical protein
MVWILTQSHRFPFPIVTIGNKERLDEQKYRERCANRLVEILFYIDNHMDISLTLINLVPASLYLHFRLPAFARIVRALIWGSVEFIFLNSIFSLVECAISFESYFVRSGSNQSLEQRFEVFSSTF